MTDLEKLYRRRISELEVQQEATFRMLLSLVENSPRRRVSIDARTLENLNTLVLNQRVDARTGAIILTVTDAK